MFSTLRVIFVHRVRIARTVNGQQLLLETPDKHGLAPEFDPKVDLLHSCDCADVASGGRGDQSPGRVAPPPRAAPASGGNRKYFLPCTFVCGSVGTAETGRAAWGGGEVAGQNSLPLRALRSLSGFDVRRNQSLRGTS